MPKTKRTKGGIESGRNTENLSLKSAQSDSNGPSVLPAQNSNPAKFPWRNIIILSLIVIGILIWKFKGYFIVATVNGQPVSRWELNDQLTARFGQQSLDTIINERLIIAAARNKGILISQDDLNNRIKQIEEKLKGTTSLSEALSAQGLTPEMFRKQLEIQLSIEKMFDQEASISTKEVENYITKNNSVYKNATDPAAVQGEVKSILKQQKVSELFENWFTEIRKNASIKKYL